MLQQVLQEMYQAGTLIFGHRGAMAYTPMNTIPAFELAFEQGAHGIELDVHRSHDGYPVVVHDFTVDATSDGNGTVTDMTLAQLKELDAGSWFDEKFRGTRIPTLDEVFEAVGQKLFVNVEIKSMTPETDGVEQVVADCIARHKMQNRVIVSSFNPYTLKRFREIAPDIALGYLLMPQIPTTHILMSKADHEARHPYYEMIDEKYMAWAQDEGYFVNTWTVNDPERAKALHALGVHGIITNNPDTILEAVRNA
jgi:glycerophosphoryl diester phosphodiesterase